MPTKPNQTIATQTKNYKWIQQIKIETDPDRTVAKPEEVNTDFNY
jgi:hypothetical protein